MTPEDIIAQILQRHPELSREQLQKRLSITRDMTGGLIEDASLLRVIAAELGVEVPQENGTFKHKLTIGHLVAGLNKATITGRVVAISQVKTFEGAKPGKFGSATIVDNDGILRVILWNEKASLIETGALKVGQIVKFSQGYTKEDRFGVVELHMGDRSQVEFNTPSVNEEDYPSIEKFATKINQITPEQRSINLNGVVKEVFGSSTFARSDPTPGKVLRFKVADGTGEVTVVAWNEKAEETEFRIRRGAQIEIVNAKAKTSQNGETEIHVDSSTSISIKLVAQSRPKISALTEELSEINLEAEVASLPICREVKTSKGETVKLTSFEIRDETGTIKITAWREHAEFTCKLLIGERILLENVYSKRGYDGGKVELSTRTSTLIARV
jgi:replication factor A1